MPEHCKDSTIRPHFGPHPCLESPTFLRPSSARQPIYMEFVACPHCLSHDRANSRDPYNRGHVLIHFR
ncbi:uncharacterized protein BDW70DRAFT_2390 [Aspergillus foveolatus]|uniref:uncharacterized protein n=1 Tax=Aspergillus foveolatus TaxID=210207 RepID=UPI003CCD38EF